MRPGQASPSKANQQSPSGRLGSTAASKPRRVLRGCDGSHCVRDYCRSPGFARDPAHTAILLHCKSATIGLVSTLTAPQIGSPTILSGTSAGKSISGSLGHSPVVLPQSSDQNFVGSGIYLP